MAESIATAREFDELARIKYHISKFTIYDALPNFSVIRQYDGGIAHVGRNTKSIEADLETIKQAQKANYPLIVVVSLLTKTDIANAQLIESTGISTFVKYHPKIYLAAFDQLYQMVNS